MEDYFRAIGLWDIITGDEEEPDVRDVPEGGLNAVAERGRNAEVARRREFQQKQAKIRTILHQTIDQDLLHLVTNLGTKDPVEIW